MAENPTLSPETIVVQALAKAAADVAGPVVAKTLEAVSPAFQLLKNILEIPEHGVGMLTDWVRVRREANLIAITQRFKQRLEQRAIAAPRDLDPGLATRMLRAAADEDDGDLQARWAELMVSAFDPKCMRVNKSHIKALEQMMPHDARILDVAIRRSINFFFPETLKTQDDIRGLMSRETGLADEVIRDAIANLKHLGLLADLAYATTEFAHRFWNLCTPQDIIHVEDPDLDAAWGRLRAEKEAGGRLV